VLKEISIGELQPNETVEAAKEARVLSKLSHPSIVRFHDSFIDGDVFCIVTEYCEVCKHRLSNFHIPMSLLCSRSSDFIYYCLVCDLAQRRD